MLKKDIEIFKVLKDAYLFKDKNWYGTGQASTYNFLAINLNLRFNYPLVVHQYDYLPVINVFDTTDYNKIVKQKTTTNIGSYD